MIFTGLLFAVYSCVKVATRHITGRLTCPAVLLYVQHQQGNKGSYAKNPVSRPMKFQPASQPFGKSALLLIWRTRVKIHGGTEHGASLEMGKVFNNDLHIFYEYLQSTVSTFMPLYIRKGCSSFRKSFLLSSQQKKLKVLIFPFLLGPKFAFLDPDQQHWHFVCGGQDLVNSEWFISYTYFHGARRVFNLSSV